jgi:hypothetical protein
VKNSDKQKVLNKIQQEAWAKTIYSNIENEVRRMSIVIKPIRNGF